jgi:hypothetical protein
MARGRNVPETPSCSVDVAAIKFNHDPAAMTADAMNIRVDRKTPIKAPEWEAGKSAKPEDSRAAYGVAETKDAKLTVKARFTITPTALTSAKVRTTDDSGGVLGSIDATDVTFDNGVSKEGADEFVTLKLAHNKIKDTDCVLLDDITWKWQYNCDGEWRDMRSTQHRIYLVLKQPPAPWTQEADKENNPWTRVLDHVCPNDEAGGTKTAADAALPICRHIYSGHGAEYNANAGGSVYTTGADAKIQTHLLTKYLDALPKAGAVNCCDQGAAATTFAAAVGCDMKLYSHRPFGYVHPIILVGATTATANPCRLPVKHPYLGPLCAKTWAEIGELAAESDEVCRSFIVFHAYAKLDGKVYDATMKTAAQELFAVDQTPYETATIDDNAPEQKKDIDYQNPKPPPPTFPGKLLASEKAFEIQDAAGKTVRKIPVTGRAVAPTEQTYVLE